jgi:hypothetical protein
VNLLQNLKLQDDPVLYIEDIYIEDKLDVFWIVAGRSKERGKGASKQLRNQPLSPDHSGRARSW